MFLKDPVKESNKVLRGAQREIERDRNQLEREKKKLASGVLNKIIIRLLFNE